MNYKIELNLTQDKLTSLISAVHFSISQLYGDLTDKEKQMRKDLHEIHGELTAVLSPHVGKLLIRLRRHNGKVSV